MKMMYMQAGLGNQMFQYAFLKYLEKNGHTDIRIDSSAPSLHKHTAFDFYRIFPMIASSARRVPYWQGRTLHLWSDVLKKGFGYSLETKGEGPDQTVIPKGKKWIRGYWQEARFAELARPELLRDFTFTEPEDEMNRQLLDWMAACESVSIHVRGGDYLEPAQRIEFGDISTPDYYREAIRLVGEQVEDPVFFVFSNDPEMAREILGEGDDRVYVSHNTGMESYRDMQLMGRCRHHIVANSSFSWWGAWLNPREDKRVYAPAKWFHNHAEDFTDRILPDTWIRVGRTGPYVSLEADFPIEKKILENILSQKYGDFELIAPVESADKRVKPRGTEPSGLYWLCLKKEELAVFKNKKYLQKKLVRMHSGDRL